MMKINLLLAALSLIAGLAAVPVGATEAAHVHRQPASVADAGRVIVKFRSNASVLVSTRASAQSASGSLVGVQAAGRMSARLGIALTDGRALGLRTQVLKSSSLGSEALAKKLAQDSEVEWAVVDGRRFITSTTSPNDPLYPDNLSASLSNLTAGQWYLREPTSTYVAAINAPGAWSTTEGSSGVVVAVLDTGIRPNHPDLAGKIVPGYDFISDAAMANDGDGRDGDPGDPGDWITAADVATSTFSGCTVGNSTWHGTQVAGIIGAGTRNGIGIAGVAPNVMILPLRVLGKCGGYDSDIIDAMRWAAGLSVPGVATNAHPAKVINMSLGGAGSCSSAYQEAVSDVNAAGAVVVAAAGNESVDVGAPANCTGVIAVGALRNVGTKAGYSNLGSAVSISAPGGNCGSGATCAYAILSTTNDGATTPANSTYSNATYDTAAIGTSFAAPMVSGTAALMLSLDSSLTPATVKDLLLSSARSFPTTGGTAGIATCQAPSGSTQQDECYCTTTTCGAGMLDSAAAVTAVAAVVHAQSRPISSITADGSRLPIGTIASRDGSFSSASAGGAVSTYSWQVVDGASVVSINGTAGAPSVSLVASSPGQATLALTVTDSQGGSAVSTQSISVLSPVQAAISVSDASPVTGSSITLSGASSTVDSTLTVTGYKWAIAEGASLASFSGGTDGETATLNVAAAGTIVVQLSVTDSAGQTSTSTQILTATEPPGGGGGALALWWQCGLLALGLLLRRRSA